MAKSLITSDQSALIEKWEEVYKRGLLTFWLLLVLHKQRAYPYELPEKIEEISQGTISVNGNSIYRSLKRFQELSLVESQMEASSEGPARRYYTLTEDGMTVLREFIRRNILVFSSVRLEQEIHEVLDD